MTDRKYTIDEVLLTHQSWIAMIRRCGGKSKNPNDRPPSADAALSFVQEACRR